MKRTKILPKNYIPEDWAGNKVQPGDLVFLYQVYELDYTYNSGFGMVPFPFPIPNFDRPCWNLVCSFKVLPYKEGAEKLVLYLRDGYQPDKTYEVNINGNSLRDGCGKDHYILCIDGKSNDRDSFFAQEQLEGMNKAINDLLKS